MLQITNKILIWDMSKISNGSVISSKRHTCDMIQIMVKKPIIP